MLANLLTSGRDEAERLQDTITRMVDVSESVSAHSYVNIYDFLKYHHQEGKAPSLDDTHWDHLLLRQLEQHSGGQVCNS